MYRSTITVLAVALFATSATFAAATVPTVTELPEGEHFTLNILGKEHVGAGTGKPGGSRIFVPLWGDCRIDLSEGEFAVQDADCVNDGAAAFQLPNPDPEGDGVSSYRVYVRALGTPGGSATLNTCKEDSNGDTWCSTETVFVARAAGQSPQMDVTKETLTVCYDSDGDGDNDRETIFSDANADYFWSYENEGLRLAQLRFYPDTPTAINQPCPPA